MKDVKKCDFLGYYGHGVQLVAEGPVGNLLYCMILKFEGKQYYVYARDDILACEGGHQEIGEFINEGLPDEFSPRGREANVWFRL